MKNIKSLYLSLVFFYLFHSTAFAQKEDNPRLSSINIIELGIGFGSKYFDENINDKLIVEHNDALTLLEIKYLHLWPIKKRFYLGLGSSYDGMKITSQVSAKTVIINGVEKIETTREPGGTHHFIPIFGQARYYFRNKPESAFLTADIGSFFKLDNNEGKPRLFWGLGFGQRYKINSANAISWGIDYHEHYLFRKKQGFNEPNENPRIASLAIKIGLLF